jgi:hypothetical protein
MSVTDVSIGNIWARHLLWIVVCLLCFVDETYAYGISDVEEPPGASSVTYVGDLVQNGLPMQIKQFKSNSSVSEILAFYKQRWSDSANRQDNVPAYIEKKVGEWQVLSKMESTNSVVVQLKQTPEGQAEGFISVTDLSRAEGPNEWSNEFPRMHGSKLISNTESQDKGRHAYTLILINDYSVAENRDYYQANMDSQGWSYSRGGMKDNISMMYFIKDNWHCDMTVTEADNGKTIIFANLVEMNENS